MDQRLSGAVPLDDSGAPVPDFRLIFETAPALSLILTPALGVAAVSDSFLRATHLERDAVLGRSLDDLFPGATLELTASLKRVLEGQVPDAMDPLRSAAWGAATHPKAVRARQWNIVNSPVFGADRQVSFVVHRLVDVTEPLKLKRHDAALEEQVLEGTRELSAELEDKHVLEEQFRQAQKMEGVAQLAAGLAHDFNNTVTVILSYARFVREDLGPAHASRPDLLEIEQAASRAMELTRQLLTFSRKQVLDPKILDLNEVVVRAQPMLRSLVSEDTTVVTALTASLGRVKADRGHLEQMLVNLAVNARDAMPRGGTLTVATANVQIESGQSSTEGPTRPGAYVMLSVTDTGLGMEASTRQSLFTAFRTTKKAGTGLGLAMVHGIVKQSEGEISVVSEPGQGSSFKIFLPRYLAPENYSAQGVAAAPFVHSSQTVLIVEDEAALRSAATRVLQKSGYNVFSAATADEALALCSTLKVPLDLLLTDVVMPGLDGPALARKLRVARPALKVLFTSGYTNGALVNHGVLEAGLVFLQKPFDPDALLAKVAEALLRAAPETPAVEGSA